MDGIAIISPVEPHHLDKKQRFQFNDLVRRVSRASCLQGNGLDLLLRVYLAGMYHGVAIMEEKTMASPINPNPAPVKRRPLVDEKCFNLARDFLSDEQNVTEQEVWDLAGDIQTIIEDQLAARRK